MALKPFLLKLAADCLEIWDVFASAKDSGEKKPASSMRATLPIYFFGYDSAYLPTCCPICDEARIVRTNGAASPGMRRSVGHKGNLEGEEDEHGCERDPGSKSVATVEVQ